MNHFLCDLNIDGASYLKDEFSEMPLEYESSGRKLLGLYRNLSLLSEKQSSIRIDYLHAITNLQRQFHFVDTLPDSNCIKSIKNQSRL